jgi:mannose-6-phosphate isomerase-like protein (cupin superfamily)
MTTPRTARFRPAEVAATFPETASTLLLDRYLTDSPSSSSRVFRVYRPTPPHYHQHSDEYLYVLSGTGTFWMDSPSNTATFARGDLLYFQRTIVHAQPEIHSGPVVFLAFDSPRRDPKDIIFVNAADGTPESFIQPASQ